MITINLLKTNDPNNKITKATTSLAVYNNCLLKDDCSVIDPVIILESSTNISDANYCYIPDLHRYYYIRDIKILNNNRYELSLHVDVLMSYSAGLLNCDCIAAKNESRFNLYLNDPNYKCFQKDHVLFNEFNEGFTSNPRFVLALYGPKEVV